MCGEHILIIIKKKYRDGSSPRVWGTFHRPVYRSLTWRFIPTCVGNIVPFAAWGASITVHPHVCGEHYFQCCKYSGRAGSSPRVWGTSAWVGAQQTGTRFIPTCVGNIGNANKKKAIEAVHPHVCGEHKRVNLYQGTLYGSSPRVWGTSLQKDCC